MQSLYIAAKAKLDIKFQYITDCQLGFLLCEWTIETIRQNNLMQSITSNSYLCNKMSAFCLLFSGNAHPQEFPGFDPEETCWYTYTIVQVYIYSDKANNNHSSNANVYGKQIMTAWFNNYST